MEESLGVYSTNPKLENLFSGKILKSKVIIDQHHETQKRTLARFLITLSQEARQ